MAGEVWLDDEQGAAFEPLLSTERAGPWWQPGSAFRGSG